MKSDVLFFFFLVTLGECNLAFHSASLIFSPENLHSPARDYVFVQREIYLWRKHLIRLIPNREFKFNELLLPIVSYILNLQFSNCVPQCPGMLQKKHRKLIVISS